MNYILILILACGTHCVGPSAIRSSVYSTQAACKTAGAAQVAADRKYLTYTCSQTTAAVSVLPPPPQATVTPAPPGHHFSLTLVFACAPDDVPCDPRGLGAGSPPAVAITTDYDTLEHCQGAGEDWLKPASNPTGTVKTYICAVNKDDLVCP